MTVSILIKKGSYKMTKHEKFLLGAAIAVGAADAALAYGVWLKKKGIALKDVVLKNIDDLHYKKNKDPNQSAEDIPISGEDDIFAD